MLEALIIGAFAAALLTSMILPCSILIPLMLGFALFFGYGVCKGHSFREMAGAALSGLRTMKTILVTFVLIGMLTAFWRVGGTIPFLVYHATRLCTPSVMLLMTFLLCCLVSFLTGTSFGTAATMGVICATMAASMGLPPAYTGGAVLAGAYFGDRGSPMSASTLLVAGITGTDVFRNVARMAKTALAPFLLSCALYLALGMRSSGGQGGGFDPGAVFAAHFDLSPWAALPVAVIVVLSLLRVNAVIALSASIAAAAGVSIFLQGMPLPEVLRAALMGCRPEDPQLAALLTGGGILSMAEVFLSVGISSCYAGMFRTTGFLDGAKGAVARASGRLGTFATVFATGLLTGMITCSQALTAILTHQLCGDLTENKEDMAVYLENTTIILPAVIPWSTASFGVLAMVGAPTASVAAACYLWLIPLWNLAVETVKDRKRAAVRA